MSIIADHKCSHEENRIKVCAPCGRKIIRGSKPLVQYSINEKQNVLIKKFVNAQFDLQDLRYPQSICETCRKVLNEYEKGNTNRALPKMPNYNDILLPKQTRSTKCEECNCYICIKGRFKGQEKTKKGRGNARKMVDKISVGLYGASDVNQLSRNIEQVTCFDNYKVPSYQVCSKCLQTIGKGIKHPCRPNPGSAKKHVMTLVDKLEPKQKEQIASDIIKRKVSICSNNKRNENVPLSLSTGGTKTYITVKPNHHKTIFFDEEKLDNYRVNSNASSSEMCKLTNFLRCTAGKNSVPKYYRNHMRENAKSLESVYELGIFDFEIEDTKIKNKIENRPVVWAKADNILESVITHREIIGNYVIKIMADGGQGFFKVTMTILPENYSDESSDNIENESDDSDTDYLVPEKKTEIIF